MLVSGSAFADGYSEPQYSKFQSNYYFTCPQPAACVGAFQKMLAAPEITDKGFEASLYALGHNGWDDSTHMVSFCFKNAERYLEAGRTFAQSPAFKEFTQARMSVGVETQSESLTTHSIVEGDGRGTKSMVNWSIKVSDPAMLLHGRS